MKVVYNYYTDPGHGWLAVPLAELEGFVPSEYSYLDDTFAYLEEDCDLDDWMDHVGIEQGEFGRGYFWDSSTENVHTDDESFIRGLDRFPVRVMS